MVCCVFDILVFLSHSYYFFSYTGAEILCPDIYKGKFNFFFQKKLQVNKREGLKSSIDVVVESHDDCTADSSEEFGRGVP